MAEIMSATISGTSLTIVYDEAMTALSPGGIFSSTGAPIDVVSGGFAGSGTNTWMFTLNTSIATNDYIVIVSNGMNAIGTDSGTYLGQGTSFVGGTGNSVMDLANLEGDFQNPFAVFGNAGSDTISTPSWSSDLINLYEPAAASDTVSFDDQWAERPLQQMDLVVGFDVKGTATNDKLNLLSGTIAGNTGTINGTDVGGIASHSIAGGIVTFKNAGGAALAIGIDAELEEAYQYLEANITSVGTTVAFQGNGIVDGLLVFQKGTTGTSSFITALDGISGATLGNAAGLNVVQIVDTTAPMVQNAAMTSTGLAAYFSEIVTTVNTTGIKLYKNGVTDMGDLTPTLTGATVTLASSTQTLGAADFVVLDTTAMTGANTATDANIAAPNTGFYIEPFKMAFGGAGNNIINLAALSGVNAADGGAGADTITGTTGDDEIDGGDGNDRLIGGAGNDDLNGDAGNDFLDGGTGNDYMDGGAGDDTYVVRDVGDNCSEDDSDILTGGNDTVETYLADTSLNWTIENIRIMSASAANVHGNDLDNTIYAGAGNNVMDGGWNGIDTLSYTAATAGVTVNLSLTGAQTTGGSGSDTISGFENLTGSKYADTLSGDAGANTLIGGLGVDTLSYATATGGVKVNLAVTTRQAVGDGGNNDTISGFENLTGSNFADTLYGNWGANTIIGGGGDDLLLGGAGRDVLNGGLGIDKMTGGTGNDIYYVNVAGDLTIETSTVRTEIDTVISTVTRTLGANLERLTLSGAAAINGTGNTLANILTGNGAANTLNGAAGNDILNGGLGNDTLIGSTGNDTLTGGAGYDSFLFNTALNASTNKDTITDFAAVYDTIKLENAIFTQLITTGTLAAANFRASTAGTAADANDYILYDTDSGALFYDADGNGAGARVQFALLGVSSHPTITNADFVVY